MATKTNDELRQEVESLKKAMADKPDIPKNRWDATNEEVTISGTNERAGNGHRLLRGWMKPGRDYERQSEFRSFSDFIRAGLEHNGSAAFEDRLHKAWNPLRKAVQGLNESVGSEGGYFVLPEFSQQIFEKVYSNDIFGRTMNFTVAGNNMSFLRSAETSRKSGSRAGGIQGYWVAEGESITKSKPKTKQLTLKLWKLAVVVYLTEELVDDAGGMAEQFVVEQASKEFEFMLGDAIFNGSGVGQPTGIHKSGALLAITPEVGQDADTIVTENIDKMWARRWAGGKYDWFCNQDTDPQLSQLSQAVGTGGAVLYRPPGGLSGAPYASLKGANVINTEFNETLGDQGDITLADLSQVVSITKGGIAQAESMHVEFLTDQRALRFTMRVAAAPWEDQPTEPYKGTNTQSSFVTLAAR